MRFYRFLVDGLLPRFAVAVVVSALLAWVAWSAVVPELVWRQYRAEMQHHVLAPPPVDHGAGSSDIAYLSMTYDCSGGDVVITATPPQAPYWQIGIYDLYVRAIEGGHLNHRTVLPEPDGTFRIRVTPHPAGAPNTLDCSTSPRGMLIYRVVLPDGPVPAPAVTVGG